MFGSISIVTAYGVLSQFVGFFRMAIIASALGLTTEVDAYYLGLALPTLMIMVAGNWVQLVFLGRYTTLLTEERLQLAEALKRRMLRILLGSVVPFTLILYLFPQPVLSLFLSNEQVGVAASALKLLCLITVPIIAADFMGQTLNGHHRFGLAAFAPLANAVVATLVLWLWPEKNLDSMTWSLLLGAMTQLAIVAPTYLSLSLGQQNRDIEIGSEVSSIFWLSLPVIPAVILSNATLSVLQFSVSRLGEGAVSVMAYANRINAGMGQLLVMGLGTVLLPYFASLIARGDDPEQVRVFRKLARVSVAACCIVTALVYCFGEIGLSVLFQRGEFSGANVHAVSQILLVLSVSLLPLSMGTFIARFFAATRRTDLIAWSGMVGFTVTVAVSIVGVQLQEILVIASAPAISFSSTTIFWIFALSTKLEIRNVLKDGVESFARISAVVIPMIVIDHLIEPFLKDWPTFLHLLTRGSVMIFGIALVAYLMKTTQWIFTRKIAG